MIVKERRESIARIGGMSSRYNIKNPDHHALRCRVGGRGASGSPVQMPGAQPDTLWRPLVGSYRLLDCAVGTVPVPGALVRHDRLPGL